MSAAEAPEPASLTAMHPLAAKGFNADQRVYEAARPTYPASVVEIVSTQILPSLQEPRLASQLAVLDLAAGTGKWTRLMEPFGIGQLVAVEPSPGMREQFSALHSNIPIMDGSATSIPYPNDHFDAVFVAQAFHWFANLSALTEIHRVLKPGGVVVLIWNMEDRRTPWVGRLREAYEKHEAGTPQYRLGLWRRPFQDSEIAKLVAELFELPIEEKLFEHAVLNTRENVWQRVLSKSYVSVLDELSKEELQKEVDKVLEGEDVPWCAVEGAEPVLKFPYTTDVVWFRKHS